MALYKSAYAAFQVLVRSESPIYHQATGVEIGRIKPLVADFGEHGGTIKMPDPLTGAIEDHALIHGHFYDTEAAQEKNGWTDEERESVEYAIDKLTREQPFLVARVEFETQPAPKPWPTFDEMNTEQVLVFANSLGLVREALVYEQENKARKTLVTQLEEALGNQPVQDAEPEPQEAITL